MTPLRITLTHRDPEVSDWRLELLTRMYDGRLVARDAVGTFIVDPDEWSESGWHIAESVTA